MLKRLKEAIVQPDLDPGPTNSGRGGLLWRIAGVVIAVAISLACWGLPMVVLGNG